MQGWHAYNETTRLLISERPSVLHRDGKLNDNAYFFPIKVTE